MWSWIKNAWVKLWNFNVCTICGETVKGMLYMDNVTDDLGHKECILNLFDHRRQREMFKKKAGQ